MKKKQVTATKYTDLTFIVEQDRHKDYCTDSIAEAIMTCVSDKLSPDLWQYLIGMLQGFREDVQIDIADDILDFVNLKMIHMTGVPSVDTVLFACYEQIAQETGYKLTDLQYYID